MPHGILDNFWMSDRAHDRSHLLNWHVSSGVKGRMLVFNQHRTYRYSGKSIDALANAEKVSAKPIWSTQFDYKSKVIYAMALTTKVLWAAGKERPSSAKNASKKNNGFLWAISVEDGTIQNKIELSTPPIYDGLAVAGNNLFLTLQDGHTICFTGNQDKIE